MRAKEKGSECTWLVGGREAGQTTQGSQLLSFTQTSCESPGDRRADSGDSGAPARGAHCRASQEAKARLRGRSSLVGLLPKLPAQAWWMQRKSTEPDLKAQLHPRA